MCLYSTLSLLILYSMENLTSDAFSQATSSGVVVIDFYADWCGPCQAMMPQVEELDAEMSDITFYKVNIDSEGELAQAQGVQSIPTFMIFKNGEKVDTIIGSIEKEDLAEKIKAASS